MLDSDKQAATHAAAVSWQLAHDEHARVCIVHGEVQLATRGGLDLHQANLSREGGEHKVTSWGHTSLVPLRANVLGLRRVRDHWGGAGGRHIVLQEEIQQVRRGGSGGEQERKNKRKQGEGGPLRGAAEKLVDRCD